VSAASRPGCCGACDGYGRDASAPETGGMCWDCRGTGHAHDGRCRSRFLDWFHLHALGLLQAYMVWLLLGGIALITLALHDQVWSAYVYAAISGVWWFGWLGLDLAADRQIKRYGLPPARRQ
jgi:hypothetical protein